VKEYKGLVGEKQLSEDAAWFDGHFSLAAFLSVDFLKAIIHHAMSDKSVVPDKLRVQKGYPPSTLRCWQRRGRDK
jgi:hypothetical protein